MTLISIIVPVYNTPENYLRKCIESLLNQTCTDIEIVLVNDGSTNNSGEVCDEYSNLDKRIKVLHQENQGVSVARNNGIANASGKWITFVDADDWLDIDSCKKIKDYLTEKIDILIFAMRIKNSKKNLKNPFWYKQNTLLNEKEIEEIQLQILHPKLSSFTPPSAMVGVAVCKVYKREFLKKFNLLFNDKLTYSEDRVFAFEALEYAKNVFYVDEYLYNYRTHDNSVTKKFRATAIHENNNSLIVLDNLINLFNKDEKFSQAFKYRLILSVFILSNQYFCHTSNNNPINTKIRELRSLCKSDMYNNAIKNTSFSSFRQVSTNFQFLGFILLKTNNYLLFYFLVKLKNKIKK